MNGMKRRVILATALYGVALLAGAGSLTAYAEDTLDEASLIDVLKSDAGWLEKQAACRGLRQAGTAASVPALAALLGDEKLSHMARYALEPMPCPEAGQALRDALGKTTGLPKAGVIISLGIRRDPLAVPLLTPLLADSDGDIARATAGALGRIATPEAAGALMDFAGGAPKAVRPALAEGLLAAGLCLTEEGRGKEAAAIYRKLLGSAWPMYVRMGAFRGLVYARPKQAPVRLMDALAGDEPLFRDMAAQLVAETSGADTTVFYADALAKLPAGGQAALLRGLADRGDPLARPAAAAAANSPDSEVRLAAVKALGKLGGPEDVPALSGWLASDDAGMAAAAQESLTAMQAPGVDAAIATAVPEAVPAVRAALLELLADRRAEPAVTLAIAGLDDADRMVRIAGLHVLGLLGGTAETPVLVAAVVEAVEPSEQAAAEKALIALCARRGGEALPAVRDAMSGAGPDARIVLLRALAQIGGPEALDRVHAGLGDAEEQVAGEAVRLLSNWPTLDAAPHLRALAENDDLNRHVLGLRGYIRLAGAEPAAEAKARMLTEAMGLARRPDEKKLALSAWGTLPTEQSINVLRPHLEDADVRNEAALAIIAVAGELGKRDEAGKICAADALKAVIEKCEDAGIRGKAQRTLEDLP